MARDWRLVMQFPEGAKLGFDEVHTRYQKLSRATSDPEVRRELVDAYDAARKELGTGPTGAEDGPAECREVSRSIWMIRRAAFVSGLLGLAPVPLRLLVLATDPR